jgi:hypothetical protein
VEIIAKLARYIANCSQFLCQRPQKAPEKLSKEEKNAEQSERDGEMGENLRRRTSSAAFPPDLLAFVGEGSERHRHHATKCSETKPQPKQVFDFFSLFLGRHFRSSSVRLFSHFH